MVVVIVLVLCWKQQQQGIGMRRFSITLKIYRCIAACNDVTPFQAKYSIYADGHLSDIVRHRVVIHIE